MLTHAAAAILASLVLQTTSALSIGVEPDSIIAGDVGAVIVRVHVASLEPDEVVLRVEAGTLEPLTRADDGTLTATWYLPADLTPRRLAVGVIDIRRQAAAFGTLAIARRARFETRSRAGSRVQVLLGGKVVAAGETTEDGQLVLNVLVPAGSANPATVEHTIDGVLVETEQMELGTRDTLRLWGIHGGAASTNNGRLHLFAYRDSGAPVDEAGAEASSKGRSLPVTQASKGVWHAEVEQREAPPDEPITTSSVAVRVVSGKEVAAYQIVVPTSRHVQPSWKWAVGPQVGFVTDFDKLTAPSVWLATTVAPGLLSGRLAFVLDVGLSAIGHTITLTDAAKARTTQWFWHIPFDIGAQYSWYPWQAWTVSAGVGMGVLASIVETSRAKTKTSKAKDEIDANFVWHGAAWTAFEYALGPGAWVFGMRASTTAPNPRAWGKHYFALEWLTGYRFAIDD